MVEENELIVIYSGNSSDVDFLKSLLEAEGITTFLKDQIMGTIAPFYVTAGGVGAVKLAIPKKDIERAKPILEKFLSKGIEKR